MFELNGRAVDPKGHYVLQQGDTLKIADADAGGDGYGDPCERDPSHIATDLKEGFLTPDAAKRDYGYPGKT